MHCKKSSSKQRKQKNPSINRRSKTTSYYGGFCCSCRLSISSPEETSTPTSYYGGFCCSCRLSISSQEDVDPDYSLPDYLSAILHVMVQERLERLILETEQRERMKTKGKNMMATNNPMVHEDGKVRRIALAVEKVSSDPREELRESMLEMIKANKMERPDELRELLECYLSMNSEDCAGLILEVFHEVCTCLFMDCVILI